MHYWAIKHKMSVQRLNEGSQWVQIERANERLR